jgi:hypothetical protein
LILSPSIFSNCTGESIPSDGGRVGERRWVSRGGADHTETAALRSEDRCDYSDLPAPHASATSRASSSRGAYWDQMTADATGFRTERSSAVLNGSLMSMRT